MSHCKDRDKRVAAGANAIQEEFDERGLGDASLIAQVVIDESGYPDEVAGLRKVLGNLVSYIDCADPGIWGHRRVTFSATCPELLSAREVLLEPRKQASRDLYGREPW